LRRDELDDSYLTDLVDIALRGYTTRLDHGGAMPPVWVAYLLLGLETLAERAADPRQVRKHADRFSRLPHADDGGLRYVRAALRGEAPDRPRPAADPERSLLRSALLVAAEDDADAWRDIVAHVDLERGLFRRSLDSPLGTWQLHPALLCAVVRRIEHYCPPSTESVVFPEPPGDGPLTHAGLLDDPPELTHSYDLEEYAVVPDLVGGVLGFPRSDQPFMLCVRHDVDRRLDRGALEHHLELEQGLGCRSSWYFKRETFDPELAAALRSAGCEVGYHADVLSTGDSGFVEELRAWLGEAPGMTFHGGLGADAFRGRGSLVQAARLGVAYAELLIGVRSRPALWPHESGWLPLAPLPVKIDTFPDRAPAHVNAVAIPGGLVIVENHPDLCEPQYIALLEALAKRTRVRLTVRQAISRMFDDEILKALP
jgi:hypothetical protein